jgi:hypothetical protein
MPTNINRHLTRVKRRHPLWISAVIEQAVHELCTRRIRIGPPATAA